MALLAYLGHHLAVNWGPLRRPQRSLGLGLLATCALLLVSGGLLSLGREGGFPALLVEVHYFGTFVLAGLLLLHGLGPSIRRLSSRRSGPVDGGRHA